MHLEVLSRLSMLLMDDEFRTNLLDAADVTEFLAHIDEAERKKFPEEYGEEKQEQDQDQPEEGYRVLAVTACPTGIAHTYMAAESLENKANDVPDSGRIYRHGDCGQTALMPGIVGGLLAKSGMTMAAEEAGWVSSGFFGALIAGFAAGLIMLGLKKILEKLPKALEGTKPMLLYPFLGIAAMGALMVFVVNPPVGAFNEWLNQVLASMGESSRVLLGAVLGGMVPPIGIALATLFFKKRFTKSEQQTVATNFIMGLSFITEGAIPFAASDPLRIIPPCIAGSAVAGALSMLFGCGSRAPHGGIFVIGIIDNPLLFLAAVAAGSVVAMLGIVLLKKPLAAK